MKPQKIIVTGMQAAGKGTQSKKIAEYLGIDHISTGDILRKYISSGSELVNGYSEEDMNAGKFASESVMDNVMREELGNRDSFILDGYPRNSHQVSLIDSSDIDIVFHLEITPKLAMERMEKRGRADDTPDAIAERINTYYQETFPMIADDLVTFPNFSLIDASEPEEITFEDIKTILDNF